MPGIPDNWKTLNVSETFRLKGSYPSNLRIKRLSNSDKIYAEWLPDPENDPRPFQGRCSNGKGKRLTIRETTGTDDPKEAAKQAIRIYADWLKESISISSHGSSPRKTSNTLSDYWEKYYSKACESGQHKRNYKRWQREEKLKWDADEYGVGKQPWALISADKITAQHLRDYFLLIENRVRRDKETNGHGMKAQQKTLINKLFELAELDFPGHSFPRFPKISKCSNEVPHLRKEQWERLLQAVLGYTDGVGRSIISRSDYESLQWTKSNRLNQRNWVDLHDALCLQWFFYLRAEDMYRIRAEWFEVVKDSETGENTVICNLETTKKDRQKHKTYLYRPDGLEAWKRISARKPNGYLVYPHIERELSNPANCSVLSTLTHLLKHAVKNHLREIDSSKISWTTIRHTAFRLTLEECPWLGVEPKLGSFAANGHTSSDQLRKTYLRYIEAEKTAQTVRKTIPEGNFAFYTGKQSKK